MTPEDMLDYAELDPEGFVAAIRAEMFGEMSDAEFVLEDPEDPDEEKQTIRYLREHEKPLSYNDEEDDDIIDAHATQYIRRYG